ncbi:MAG: hypothetical protein QOJ12_3643, partial [Thermoleophilales bacterium]|nr:hypothetical protein [Thermoleophilales bacterium]
MFDFRVKRPIRPFSLGDGGGTAATAAAAG